MSTANILYTKDGIPIDTIFIKKLPFEANENNLKSKLSRFGEISSLKILAKIEKSRFRCALIRFRVPRFASKAIKAKRFMLEKKTLFIKLPKSQTKAHNQLELDDESSCLPENPSLLILNDDCLLHIFSFLTLNVQFKLSQLCERFDHIFKVNFKSNKCIDYNDLLNMTVMESQELITKCEKDLKCLQYNISTEWIFNSINEFDHFYPVFKFLLEMDVDLERLELHDICEIEFNTYKLFFQKMKNLKTIKLKHCGITNEICSLIANCEIIEKLDLSHNYNLSGEHLSKMKNLIELDLDICLKLEMPYVISIIKSCVKLKKLNMGNCSNNALNALMDYQKNLEDLSLNISCDTIQNIERITELKNLKRLEFDLAPEECLPDTFFTDLKKNKCLTLESLTIRGGRIHEYHENQIYEMKNLQYLDVSWTPDIDDYILENIANKMSLLTHIHCAGCRCITKYGILKLIKNSNIRCIDISSCRQFSQDLIIDVIETLKIMPQKPIKFIVGGTCITKDKLEKNPKYIENRHLIRISYQNADPYDDYICDHSDC